MEEFKEWARRRPLLIHAIRSSREYARPPAWSVIRGVRRVLRPLEVGAYLRKHPVRKLHLGAGPAQYPGWLNTELRPMGFGLVELDATSAFPLPDASIDYVYHEHVIEHLDYADGQKLLTESLRVLKPGGRTRIATPDLGVIVALFTPNKSPEQVDYMATVTERYMRGTPVDECFILNNMARNWGHQFVYDRKTLARAVTQAGFINVSFHAVMESAHPELTGLECRGTDDANNFETMILEAEKPR
jgi:predicted SAM-dependent methyltransferase